MLMQRSSAAQMLPVRGNWVAKLHRFASSRPAELCEFCGSAVATDHQHLFDVERDQPMCSCRSCAIVIGGNEGRYLPMPEVAEKLVDFAISDAEWAGLDIPIGLAFFTKSDGEAVDAFYPGPAGITRVQMRPEAWAVIACRNPVLVDFKPRVEALLVDRTKGRRDAYRVPVDRCFALAAVIRRQWQGFTGGDRVWATIRSMLDEFGGVHA